VYLVVYNVACCLGWGFVLFVCAKHAHANSIDQMWPELEMGLKVVQTAAVLEVVHSLVGLVKSPWVTALMQVFSRVWTLWAVMHVAPSAQTSIFTLLACSSWALVEVPRYAFYALNLLDAVPYPLLWLRYSLFAVLYPTGITGELGCM
ncbi:tyrosine phosphatase-like protein, partial [Ochromonadaceae sp. CCMP2298]